MMQSTAPYILMLEDDGDDRHITQTFFEERGYNVGLRFLTNTKELLPFLENCISGRTPLPRLILLDKSIPSAGGFKALEVLKSHTFFRMIPVVMISGTAFQHEVDESYRLGCSSFIVKPFSTGKTASTIDSFVNYWFHTVELPAPASLSLEDMKHS